MEWFLDREPGFPDSQLVTSCPVWSLWHRDSPVGTHQHHPPGGTHLQLPQHPPTPNAPPAWQRCPQSSRSHRILWCPHPSRTATGLGCCFIPQNSHRDSRGGAAPWGRYPSQADMTSVPVFPGKKGCSRALPPARGTAGVTSSTSTAPWVGDRGDRARFSVCPSPTSPFSVSAQHCQAGKEPKKLPMSHRWLCPGAPSHAAQEAHRDWGTLPAHWHPRKLRLALNLQH